MFAIAFFRRAHRHNFPFLLLGLILPLVFCGLLTLYSAGGNLYPWAFKQGIRFIFGLLIMAILSLLDIRFWLKHARSFYLLTLGLLILVELLGFVGMGARRWVDLYIFQIQPSELMKVSLIVFMAAYFHSLGEKTPKLKDLLIPTLFLCLPILLILRQPDLGTAVILALVGGSLFFIAGVNWKIFAGVGLSVAAVCPFLWQHLKDYQKKRILIFLNPEQDLLGAGYHALQSKIAIGSGGIWGKGFAQGTQSYLDFLPEKQTDFIFTMLCEERGLVGAALLLLFYSFLLVYLLHLAFRITHLFGRFLVFGVASMLFWHLFINIGMVVGILPIVGVPLPLISYGGTSLLTFMVAFGLVAALVGQRDIRLPVSLAQQKKRKVYAI